MRMWNVDPTKLCRKHLLGEHCETHMMLGVLKRKCSIEGFLHGLYDPSQLEIRHRDLSDEMTRRGYRHKSDLDVPSDISLVKGFVDSVASEIELKRRCTECKF